MTVSFPFRILTPFILKADLLRKRPSLPQKTFPHTLRESVANTLILARMFEIRGIRGALSSPPSFRLFRVPASVFYSNSLVFCLGQNEEMSQRNGERSLFSESSAALLVVCCSPFTLRWLKPIGREFSAGLPPWVFDVLPLSSMYRRLSPIEFGRRNSGHFRRVSREELALISQFPALNWAWGEVF